MLFSKSDFQNLDSTVLYMVVASVLNEELEARSKSLFGNRHMLHVARNIAPRRRPFTVMDVARSTGVPYSSTYRLIRQLEDVGLLASTPPRSSDQHRWYRRAAHKFWGAIQQLCATVDEGLGTRKGTRDA